MKNNWFALGGVVFIIGGLVLLFSLSVTVQNFVNNIFTSEKKIYSSVQTKEMGNIHQNNEISQKTNFTLYYDFSCPYCKKFYANTFTPLQKKYSDNFSFQIIPYSLNIQSKSFEQSKWFLCLVDEKIGGISENILIEKINEKIEISSVAEVFSLSDEKNKQFLECVSDEKIEKQLLSLQKQAKEKGVRGTPTFFIGEEKFEKNQSLKKVELQILEILQ